MTAYFMQTSKDLMDKSFDERQTISRSIANVIYSTTKESLATKNYNTLNEITKKLIDNRLINFVIIYDLKNNNNIIWSSLKEITNTQMSIDEAKQLYKKAYPYDTNIRFEKGIVSQKVNVVIAYTLDSNLSHYIRDLASKNPTLAIIFLLLGSFCALVMIKLVTVPLNFLTNAVKIFSTGNFKHKIPTTYYK